MSTRYLVLADGTVYTGVGFGAPVEQMGELVFTTGMVGYIETLTDPSYAGQIVLQTFPLIGNYGFIPEDMEGACCVRGYVVRSLCERPSNFRSERTLDEFLKEQGVPGIQGIDTRAVTRRIRETGVMNALITNRVPEDLSALLSYKVQGVVQQVTCRELFVTPAQGVEKYHVALVDYGCKRGIVRELTRRGCRVTVVPAGMPAEDILALSPDGIMLSNGPGDPGENTFQIAQIKKLLGQKPLFGICLGHQLTALAAGGATGKMKYGHRGGNQPVRDLVTGRTWITSQNHGYEVLSDSLPTGTLRFENANDHTCEGVDYPELNAFTVQFHPEASAGPRDTGFLFDRFIAMMGGDAHGAQ